MIAALRPLRSRDFRFLLASNATSTIGDWLDMVAILVLVSVVWREGAGGLALVAVAMGTPALAAPFVGVLVDRHRPGAVMVGTDLVRAAATVAMVMAPNLWVLVALLALRSTAGVAFGPAAQTVIKRTVTQDNLVQANASMQVVAQALKIAGPAVGGALLGFLAPTTVIGLNAVTFLVSALILTGLRVAPRDTAGRRSSYLAELGEGVRFVRASGTLRLLVTALGGTVFLVILFDSMLALAVPQLGLETAYIGYLIAASGAGGVLGSLALAQWAAGARPFVLIGSGQLVAGSLVALLGVGAALSLDVPPVFWLGIAALIGGGAAGVLVGFPTVVQSVTPEHLLGRVWTTINAVPTVLQICAPVVGAAVLGVTGVGQLFLVSGFGLVALAALVLLRQGAVRAAPPEPATGPATGPVPAAPETADVSVRSERE